MKPSERLHGPLDGAPHVLGVADVALVDERSPTGPADLAGVLADHRSLIAWAAGRPVTIRTLDAGGDKPIPGLWGVNGATLGFAGGGGPSRWVLNKVQGNYDAGTVFDFQFGFTGDDPLVGPWSRPAARRE